MRVLQCVKHILISCSFQLIAAAILGLMVVVTYGVTDTGLQLKLQAEVGMRVELDEHELGFGQHGLKAHELTVKRLVVLGKEVKV